MYNKADAVPFILSRRWEDTTSCYLPIEPAKRPIGELSHKWSAESSPLVLSQSGYRRQCKPMHTHPYMVVWLFSSSNPRKKSAS